MYCNVPTAELRSVIENRFNQNLFDELQKQDELKICDVIIHRNLFTCNGIYIFFHQR